MPLINCETDLILTWSEDWVTSSAAANQGTTFTITDTKLNNKIKLLQQFQSGLKRTISWDKYQLKITTKNAPNQYLDYFIDLSFQGVNRLLVLAFNANDNKIAHSDIISQMQK